MRLQTIRFSTGCAAGRRAPGSGEAVGGQGDPNEVNIFGSSGGARGRTRSRVGGGAAEGDTQTTGSASVRILRRRRGGRANGAQPKLERTPTLTNDSIIELVEAGFSEGTIIRRIEVRLSHSISRPRSWRSCVAVASANPSSPRCAPP
jgi:hypothetical protein